MILAKDAVVWTCDEGKRVRVMASWETDPDCDDHMWCDPIGAAYKQWREMENDQRALLMLETAIDLTMQGYNLRDIIREFSKVDCFRALGSQSAPMCRAITSAVLGQCLEPATLSFEELMVVYAPENDEVAT
jgi:hypothetical protein